MTTIQNARLAHRHAFQATQPVTLANMSRSQLAAMYVNQIGYDPFVDDPTISVEEVRQTLAEFLAEAAKR